MKQVMFSLITALCLCASVMAQQNVTPDPEMIEATYNIAQANQMLKDADDTIAEANVVLAQLQALNEERSNDTWPSTMIVTTLIVFGGVCLAYAIFYKRK